MTTTEVAIVGVPTDVADAIREAYVEENGARMAEILLAKAEAGDERIRGYLEWDDTKAGRQFRLDQCSRLIRRAKVRIVLPDSQPPVLVRAWIARKELPATEENIEAGSFIAIEDVAGQTAYEASVADSIRRDFLRLERKYKNTNLLFAMAEEIFS